MAHTNGSKAVREWVGSRGLKTTLFLLIFLFCLAGESRAAFEGEVGVEGMWTDNLYLTANPEEDVVTSPSGYVESTFRENFGFRYTVDGYVYHSHSELNALWQQAALLHHTSLAETYDLNVEIGYDGILHVADSESLDHHQVGAILDLEVRPSPRLLITPGIQAYWRTFPRMENLDYIEAVGNLLANRSFETRTTLRLNGTFYFKRFLNKTLDNTQSGATHSKAGGDTFSSWDALEENDPQGRGDGGSGKGEAQSGANRGKQRRLWQGNPPSGSTVEGNLESQSAAQLLIAARLAQSLGSWAGIFAEGTYRKNFLDPPRFAEGSIPGPDRGVFDDHYGYEGPGGRMQVSVLLPLSMRVVLSGLLEERRFAGREALDIEGNPKDPGGEDRRDEHYEVAIWGEFSHDFRKGFTSGITASTGYAHVWNDSNDDWYDTEENRVFVSLSLLW